MRTGRRAIDVTRGGIKNVIDHRNRQKDRGFSTDGLTSGEQIIPFRSEFVP